MMQIRAAASENDGSSRLYAVCCRAVEFALSDREAIDVVREYEKSNPFPRQYGNNEICDRLRDAEHRARRGSRLSVTNYTRLDSPVENGKKTQSCTPKPLNEIVAEIHRITSGWPRRVGNAVFADDTKNGIRVFKRSPSTELFAWLKSGFTVDWKRGNDFVTQSELYAELAHVARVYNAIDSYPHEPLLNEVYYRCEIPRTGDGTHLNELVGRFRPEHLKIAI